jgi:signal peptidase I
MLCSKVYAALLVFCFGTILSAQVQDTSCIKKREPTRVEGNSLAGWINPNAVITIWYGYYACNPLVRGDFVIFRHGSSRLPLIKKVVALPGDTFTVRPYKTGYCYLINGDTVRGANRFPLFISARRGGVLKYYEEAYKGKLPSNACFVSGSSNDTYDSTLFGPVGVKELQGKAILPVEVREPDSPKRKKRSGNRKRNEKRPR